MTQVGRSVCFLVFPSRSGDAGGDGDGRTNPIVSVSFSSSFFSSCFGRRESGHHSVRVDERDTGITDT